MRASVLRILILAVLCCSLLIAGAAAETMYQTLCEQRGISGADVIAWLEIPGAEICEPVMRHPTDDTYYAKHAPYGAANEYGSLYVQAKYNAADFSDPVTLIYGSSASELMLFGRLQQLYSGSFRDYSAVYLHLPEETCRYEVFAAVPYSSLHILHYYDFSTVRRYNIFFDGVYSTRALGMHLVEEKRPEPGKDQVVILSTGLRGDPLQRYLVMARRHQP